MILRRAVARVLFCCVVFATRTAAQGTNRYRDVEARVLDIALSQDATTSSYLQRMVLRFGDSDTQLVAIVYPDKEKYWIRRGEIIRYTLAHAENGTLSQLIEKMVAQNPDVKDEEIAAQIKVNVKRWPIEPKVLYGALKKLKDIRISPLLTDRICVDECPEFGYWYTGISMSRNQCTTPSSGTARTRLRTNLCSGCSGSGRNCPS